MLNNIDMYISILPPILYKLKWASNIFAIN